MIFRINVNTSGQGLYEITDLVTAEISQRASKDALLTLFIQHTSASLLIQENADPTVILDLNDAFARLAPETEYYRHNSEGPDDMPAHLKSALTATSLSVPMEGNRLLLGRWQGIYVFEHRREPQQRCVVGALTPTV